MFLGDGRALVGSSKVSKSQVDTIAEAGVSMRYKSSKVSKSQVDTIAEAGVSMRYKSSKVSKSQVDTINTIQCSI